jgi:membrane protein insertase Oxa1/YidC/SpoIIIJ
LELIFEKVFHFLFSVTNSYGLAILLVSVLISVILMPFYHITGILEDKEKAIRLKLQPYISKINKIKDAHIRHKHLSKLYKVYNYSPIMSLRSLSSLVIQIPFFIVAYKTLSKILIANPYNASMSFLFIKNLGLQDNLIGGVNLLPILMTAINILTVMCMTSFPKERRQSYAISVFFLIFLYTSPAGLVLYWTSNNLINLFRYLFAYLKNKRLKEGISVKLLTKRLANCFLRLLNNADVRAFVLLIAVYFAVNTKMNNIEYLHIIALPWYILFALKLYEYKLKSPSITKNVKIQLSLVILCFIASCFVKRWEKTHWLFAALTLCTIYDYRSIKLVKIKKILKFLLLPVLGMLFPAVLYVKANAIYINGWGYVSYFAVFVLAACFIPLVIYIYNAKYSMSKVIKVSLSFILAAMLLPLVRDIVKYTGDLPYDFIFLLFIIYFITDLLWKKKKILVIFLLICTLYSLLPKVGLSTSKTSKSDEAAIEIPKELASLQMKDTPAIYLFMYDSFPHRELIKELKLDSSKLDALLCECQFKEYDVYSIADHTLATMAQVFNISRYDSMLESRETTIKNQYFREVLAGNRSSLVYTLFEKNGYDSFVPDDDRYLFSDHIQYKQLSDTGATNITNSLGVIHAIINGSMKGAVIKTKKDDCFKLAEFVSHNSGNGKIFAWEDVYSPGHSWPWGRGFESEIKWWKPRYYESIEGIESDLRLAIKNPNAIIILMSDHGPSLLDDASRFYKALRDDQIKHIHFRDRYGAFMAIHWPDRERAAKYDKEFNITQDLFPIVFAYLYDSPVPLKYKIAVTAVRMRKHKFDKGVFYPNFFEYDEFK